MSMFTFSLANAWVTPDKTYTNIVIWSWWDDSFWFIWYTSANSKYYQIDLSIVWTETITFDFNWSDFYDCNLPYTWTMYIYWSSTGFTLQDNMYCSLSFWDWIISNNSTLSILNYWSSNLTVNIVTVTPPSPPAPSVWNPLVGMVDNTASGSINGAEDVMSSDLWYIIYFIIAIVIISLVVWVIMYWAKNKN